MPEGLRSYKLCSYNEKTCISTTSKPKCCKLNIYNIYIIYIKRNLKCIKCNNPYIGKTNSLSKRINGHISDRRHGNSTDKFDQHIYVCLGHNNVEPYFEIYELVTLKNESKLLSYEPNPRHISRESSALTTWPQLLDIIGSLHMLIAANDSFIGNKKIS